MFGAVYFSNIGKRKKIWIRSDQMYIDVDAYLVDSLAFRPEEDALRFSFAEWLPGDIIDCHAHVGLPEHVEDIPMESYCHPISTFPSFSIEQSEWIKKLFGGAPQICYH